MTSLIMDGKGPQYPLVLLLAQCYKRKYIFLQIISFLVLPDQTGTRESRRLGTEGLLSVIQKAGCSCRHSVLAVLNLPLSQAVRHVLSPYRSPLSLVPRAK